MRKRSRFSYLVFCSALLLLTTPATANVGTWSSSPALFIPNPATSGVTTTIHIADLGTVNSVQLTVTVRHPILADVQIRLTAPGGATSMAFDRDGGVGDGLYNVSFADSASGWPPNFLTNGVCLSNVTYKPRTEFSVFQGVQMQGDWTLTVYDQAAPDSPDCDCDGMVEGPPCPRTLDSWSLRIDYSTNQAPVAQCRSITVNAAAGACTAAASVDDGSYDPDGDPITVAQSPAGPYALGSTAVTLTVTDSSGAASTCSGTVTVVDATAPVLSCNAPATITPPQAPVSFTATAVDACSTATAHAQSYDCYMLTSKGKRIDKKGSCVVSISGATVTILDSGGVGDIIEWTVAAQDGSSNAAQTTCKVTVVNPGRH